MGISRGVVLFALVLALSCVLDCTPTSGVGARSMGNVSLVAAGDIAGCFWRADAATGRLLDSIPGVVVALGDNVYPSGSAGQYRVCYGPTWGRHRSRTRPIPGNHEYKTEDAAAYFAYFGAQAGPANRGYYSYQVGEWHVVALNSEIDADATSAQAAWLREDLAASPAGCTLAYWHRPRFSSGKHGGSEKTRELWEILRGAGAEVVLSGHDHVYERFAPQRGDGTLDLEQGIRQFVVGTGGAPLYSLDAPIPNSEVRSNRAHGVLALELQPDHYTWRFVTTPSGIAADSGSGACH